MKTCPQCAEQVQNDASLCRYCGHKFGFHLPKIGCVGMAALVVLAIWAVSQLDPKTPEPPKPEISVRAQELIDAYADNEAAAQAYYSAHSLRVTGIVDAIDLNLANKAVLHLRGRSGAIVSAHLNDASQNAAVELQRGKSVTLVCNKITELMGIPAVMDCQL